MWTIMPQQQQRGVQIRRRGEAPEEAVKDREAQDHDRADQDVSPGDTPRPPVYPAGRLEDEDGDNTPSAPASDKRAGEDLPLPEGK